MKSDNPFLTKRGISLVVIFALSFFVFSFVTNTLGLFSPRYDDYGDTVNAFDAVSMVPAIVVCYILEGVVAVWLKEEPVEYRKRTYKKEALAFMCLYFAAIVLYLFFLELDFSTRTSSIVSTMPLWVYGICLFYSSLFRKGKGL